VGFHQYCIKRLYNKRSEIGDIFKGFDFFLPAFVAALLIGIFVFIGTMLCVIPGLVVASMYKFTYLFILDKKDGLLAGDGGEPFRSQERLFRIHHVFNCPGADQPSRLPVLHRRTADHDTGERRGDHGGLSGARRVRATDSGCSLMRTEPRPRSLMLRGALAAGLFAALWIFTPAAEPRFRLCGFYWLTGHPCALCGLTRADIRAGERAFRGGGPFQCAGSAGIRNDFLLVLEQ
jgi:hypothetical protein